MLARERRRHEGRGGEDGLLDRQRLNFGREYDRALNAGRPFAGANERGGEERGGQGKASRRQDGDAWIFHRGRKSVAAGSGAVVLGFAIHGVSFVWEFFPDGSASGAGLP
ncbi:MAG: hypothetical protein C0518_03010 [Opitutus sp.]|nr:hypothetical protein [Opitutus sp.]